MLQAENLGLSQNVSTKNGNQVVYHRLSLLTKENKTVEVNIPADLVLDASQLPLRQDISLVVDVGAFKTARGDVFLSVRLDRILDYSMGA